MNKISTIVGMNGVPSKMFKYILISRMYYYAHLLKVGIKEEDTHDIILQLTPFNQITQALAADFNGQINTFKEIVPQVGYDYAKFFIFEQKYNLADYPNFVNVASQLYAHNIINFRACMSCVNDGDVERILSLEIYRKQ